MKMLSMSQMVMSCSSNLVVTMGSTNTAYKLFDRKLPQVVNVGEFQSLPRMPWFWLNAFKGLFLCEVELCQLVAVGIQAVIGACCHVFVLGHAFEQVACFADVFCQFERQGWIFLGLCEVLVFVDATVAFGGWKGAFEGVF